MAIDLVNAASCVADPVAGVLDLTVNMSDATLIVALAVSAAGSANFGDSEGNDWTAADRLTVTSVILDVFFCIDPITSAEQQFFCTADGTSVMTVAGFGGGTFNGGQVEGETTTFGFSTSIALSTSVDKELVVAFSGISALRSQSQSVDAPLVLAGEQVASESVNACSAVAYLVKSPQGTVTSQFSWSRVADSGQIAMTFLAVDNSPIRRENPPICGLLLHI